MPLEIERKYLLASDAWRREVCRRQPMAQGYLVGVGGKASIRVRVAGDEARLNIKAPHALNMTTAFPWPRAKPCWRP